MNMNKVLFVDDEPRVLRGLQRALRPMRDRWRMSFVGSGPEALALIREDDYAVLVTDMRMPGMDGSRLLEAARELRPGMARIVLSGQTEQEAMFRSSRVAHQFIAKPCDDQVIRHAVERACNIRELLRDRAVIEVAGGIDSLPSLPQIYQDLTEAMSEGSDRNGASRIAEIVARDIAMSAKVLQLANSAFFGLPRTVETAQQAVMLLGVDVIRGLVLADAVYKCFRTDEMAESFSWLWQHSLAVSAAARTLARALGASRHVQALALQAGALHDLGKLVLAANFPGDYRRARELAEAGELQMHEAELRIFACDHAQVGAYLLGLWGLPDSLVEAVAHHHAPEAAPPDDEVISPLLAVFAADLYLGCRHGEGDGGGGLGLAEELARVVGAEKAAAWIDILESALPATGGEDE